MSTCEETVYRRTQAVGVRRSSFLADSIISLETKGCGQSGVEVVDDGSTSQQLASPASLAQARQEEGGNLFSV